MKYRIIAILLFTSPLAYSQTQYDRQYYENAARENSRRMQEQLRQELAAPVRQQPQYIYTPQGQMRGYILPDSQGNQQLYDNASRWQGPVVK